MLERTTPLVMCQGGYEVNELDAGFGEGERSCSGLVKGARLPKRRQFTVLVIKTCFCSSHWVFSDSILLRSQWIS